MNAHVILDTSQYGKPRAAARPGRQWKFYAVHPRTGEREYITNGISAILVAVTEAQYLAWQGQTIEAVAPRATPLRDCAFAGDGHTWYVSRVEFSMTKVIMHRRCALCDATETAQTKRDPS